MEGCRRRTRFPAGTGLFLCLRENTTDIALVIDAMDILRDGLADCFCLVASDGDYTLLAQRIREAGLPVLGYGEGKTPAPLVRACTEFLYADRMEGKPVENTPGYFLRRDMEYFDRAFEEAADGKTEVPLSLIGTALKRMMPKFKIKDTVARLWENCMRNWTVMSWSGRKRSGGGRTVETLNVFYKG